MTDQLPFARSEYLLALPDRGILELSGPDCRDFLQGLITNDIARLNPEQALYTGLLTPQGKYLFDFLLVQHEDMILIDCHAAQVGQLIQRLMMYRLRSAVEIRDATADWILYADLDGSTNTDAAGWVVRAAGVLVVSDPRHVFLGHRLLVPADAEQPKTTASGDAYHAARIQLGIPDGTMDMLQEKTFWLETNAAELNGVSFTKGCYVGQEMTARMHHRTTLKKRFMPITATKPLPASGTPIMAGDKIAGDLRSSCGNSAIAYLRIEYLTKGPLTCEDTEVTPVVPDWIDLECGNEE